MRLFIFLKLRIENVTAKMGTLNFCAPVCWLVDPQ